MWIIEPLEILREGNGTGKFRLTATSDEDGGGPLGLCEHEHESKEAAMACFEAKERSHMYGAPMPVPKHPFKLEHTMPRGWLCPNCGKAHAPEVKTCPYDTRSLRNRIH